MVGFSDRVMLSRDLDVMGSNDKLCIHQKAHMARRGSKLGEAESQKGG